MPVISAVDAYQQRHRRVGFPLAVVYKFIDDQGGYLAALIAFYGFLSVFPLLLLGSAVLGLLLAGDARLQQDVLSTALSQIPVVGEQLTTPERLGGGAAGVVVGGLTALYGGLGVAVAFQNAMNTAWRVPRNSRPNLLKVRLRGLLLLVTVGGGVVALTVLTQVRRYVDAGGPVGAVGALVASLALNSAIFVLGFRVATARDLSVRDVAPGAVTAAVAWLALQTFGGAYVSRISSGSDLVSGVFATVVGLVGFLYLASIVVVLCVEVNVVRVDGLWPRALLTPVTDQVVLTSGDERAYTSQAAAQRSKGFQEIEVTFHPEDGTSTRP